MGELEMACAQVFRKKGKSRMPEKDFVFAVSLDFKWFTPKEAQRLLEMSIEAGVLTLEDGMVSPNFDHKNIEMPKGGYVPTKELLLTPAPPKGTMLAIVETASKKSGMDAKDIIALVNGVQDSLGVEVEIAALIVARDLGVDISGFIDNVEERLGDRCRK